VVKEYGPLTDGDSGLEEQDAPREFHVGDRIRILAPGTWSNGYTGNVSKNIGEIAIVREGPDNAGNVGVESVGGGWGGYIDQQCLELVPAEPDPEPEEATSQGVEWPAEPGWYWASGEDRGNPAEGIARLNKAGNLNGVDRDWQDWSIYRDVDGDRLDSAVRVTPVPTELIEELRRRMERDLKTMPITIGTAAETAHAIFSWLDQHEEAQR
jgi:hypothetical protein